MFHAVVIEESLADKSILLKYKILNTRISERWRMHIIELLDAEKFIGNIQTAMVLDAAYYFHVYDDKNYLAVAFNNRVFLLNSQDKSTWLAAQQYGGEKLGIPAEELDFVPNSFGAEKGWLNGRQ